MAIKHVLTWDAKTAAPSIAFGGVILAAIAFMSISAATLLLFPACLFAYYRGFSKSEQEALRNQYAKSWGLLVTMSGLAVLVALSKLIQENPDDGLIILGFVALYCVYRLPSLLAGGLVYIAATNGGQWVLFAAPVVVLLAARGLEVVRSKRLGWRLWLRSMAVALLAFLLAFLVSNLGFGGEAGGSSESAALQESARPSDSSFFEWLGRLLGRDGPPAGTRPGDGPTSYRPPEDPTNWWPILGAIVVIAILAASAYFVWKRRNRSGPPDGAMTSMPGAWSMARLEQIGESVGRPRAQHEGALAYADALANHTGDERLRVAGPLISAQVFQGEADDAAVASTIEQLEAHPPQPPPVPPMLTRREQAAARFTSMATSVRQNPRAATLGVCALAAVGLFGWVVSTNTTDISLAYADLEHGLVELDRPPEELNEVVGLLADDPASFFRWETCSAISLEPFLEHGNSPLPVTGASGFLAGTMTGSAQQRWTDLDDDDPQPVNAFWQWDFHSDAGVYATTIDDDVVDLTWFEMPDSIAPSPMPTIDEVLAALPAETASSERIDPKGDSYTRYAFRQPAAEDNRLIELDGWFSQRLGPGLEVFLDVWIDGDIISRARTQSFAGTVAYWDEYRLASEPPSTLGEAFGVDCPETPVTTVDGWIGLDLDDVPSPKRLAAEPIAISALREALVTRPGEIRRWLVCQGWEHPDDYSVATENVADSNDAGDVELTWGNGGFSIDNIEASSERGEPRWEDLVMGDSVWQVTANGNLYTAKGDGAPGSAAWFDVTSLSSWSTAGSQRPLETIDQVLDAFGDAPASMSDRIDRNGDGFKRFTFDHAIDDYSRFFEESGGVLHSSDNGYPVRIDVWSTDGVIERLRSQAGEGEEEIGWIEVQILDTNPVSFADLFITPDCPPSIFEASGDWFGASTEGDS